MTTLNGRLDRLEDRIRVAGCPTCRDWRRTPQVEILHEEEADANPLPVIPDTCPSCGQPVPHPIRRITIRRVEAGTRPAHGGTEL